MDFFLEAFFELVIEGLFGLTIHNPKVKTWVKTLFFVVLTQALAACFAYVAVVIPVENGDNSGNIICGIIAAALSVGFLAAAIHGHRTDWKQADY